MKSPTLNAARPEDGRASEIRLATPTIDQNQVAVVELLDYHLGQLGPEWWEIVSIEVTDAEGAPVRGAVELHPGFSPASWRPEEPWVPGSYTFRAVVDLPSSGEGAELCPAIVYSTELVVTDRSAVPGEAWTFVADAVFTQSPIFDLDSIVCCDGAFPYRMSQPGIGCPSTPPDPIVYDGYCTPLRASGSVTVTTSVEIDGVDASPFHAIREVTTALSPPSTGTSLRVVLTEATCLEFEVLDLVTGETRGFESCQGQGREDELGELELMPIDLLEANCGGRPYTCETTDRAWWEEECTPWPSGVADRGCGCDAAREDEGGGWVLLMIAGVFGSPRRGRLAPSSARRPR